MQLLVMKTHAIIFLIFAQNGNFYVLFNTKNLWNNFIVREKKVSLQWMVLRRIDQLKAWQYRNTKAFHYYQSLDIISDYAFSNIKSVKSITSYEIIN